MSDQHRLTPTNFRPEPEEINPVKEALNQRGHEMEAFLRACLRWCSHDPEAAFKALGPFWPPPRQRGRPRKDRP